jgi:hypothetical protein
MVNKKEWETKSLEWIHKVREEIDEEIKKKGITPAEWVKARAKIDVEKLCRKMGLTKVTIIKKEPFSSLKKARVR